MVLESLNTYLEQSSMDKVQFSLTTNVPYVRFSNSNGNLFSLSLASLLDALGSIRSNFAEFGDLANEYSETPWRKFGKNYFTLTDVTAIISTQSKTTYGLCQRIVSWAVDSSELVPFTINGVDAAIAKLNPVLKKHLSTITDRNLAELQVNWGGGSIVSPKPFLLLAGISGVGKTRFVREQVKDLENFYQLVPVRPDWHEPSDLLGFVSRLSGAATYVATDVLRFIVKAWKSIASCGVKYNPHSNRWDLSEVDLDSVPTFWLCLDEMNLAPVEQYFADYLSILETREMNQDYYKSDSLISPSLFNLLQSDETLANFLIDVGIDEGSELWSTFRTIGIPIPFNLIVVGTVNMDETTHSFSRKVIDRALSFDFAEFFPNNFSDYFEPSVEAKKFSFSRYSKVRKEDLVDTFDSNGQLSIAFLDAVNNVLKDTSFQLGFRALNELLISVKCFRPENEEQLQAVWDDFLMCKVLPRIGGDQDKLSKNGENLLIQLERVLSEQMYPIWEPPAETLQSESLFKSGLRIDLLRSNTNSEEPSIFVSCRSQKKLQLMKTQLQLFGFCSFWT
ncbi:MAG: hypothetical protein Q4A31_09910 [Corynebacterium sp.]|uniref:McrB family protein n=1 Tax=Corynebacterium sp. TaxID=1720 RepID=UPI0026DB47E9|nr:hypothetical protein [Corynebacterium sp.]MDO4762221.1 hypothetical protein [Corynebacterium sp.]